MSNSKSSDKKSNEFVKGDKVEWESSQGTIEGTIRKKLTQPTTIEGHHAAASKDNPQYLVESDQTSKEAAHKPASLRPRED
jgi:Hypervirulence associated proteins TUDOR domain